MSKALLQLCLYNDSKVTYCYFVLRNMMEI